MDAFALLGLPRQAAIDPDDVRAAFQKAAAAQHPDHATEAAEKQDRTARLTALNEAQAVLVSVPRRLRHLLELSGESAADPRTPEPIDDALLTLFSMAGSAVHAASEVQTKMASTTSALARAMLTAEEMRAQEALTAASGQLSRAHDQLEDELTAIDAAAERGEAIGSEMRTAAHRAAFLEKWQAQVRAAFAGFAG